ncbi:MAG: SPASM domain-containing protein [Planctomycetes bacterium]|nr:SPASM domain-containing protein [Planctomycetota bacterium]
MNVVGVMQADLKTSPLGTASRLSEDLCGVPVLTRTVRRAHAARRLDTLVVVCPEEQYEQVCALVDADGVEVRKFDGSDYVAAKAVRVARKWSIESWRGGMGNSCFFDEHTHPALCLTIAAQTGADAIVSIAAGAPLIDPQMIDDIIGHFENESENTKLVFAQSPPGLSPALFSPVLLEEVIKVGMSPGWVNSYRPDQPQRDMINVPACFRPPMAIQAASGRLTSDTRRGFELLQRLAGDTNGDGSAGAICRKLMSIREQECASLPREVQVELTTEDQLSGTILRPRGDVVGRRGPLNLDILARLLENLCQYDDSLIVLGGFGEPLLHPDFEKALQLCREANVFGLAVRTNGMAMNEDVARAICDNGVDVVQVLLDANDAEGYHRVHGVDAWDDVVKNMDVLNQLRQSRTQVNPIIAASLTKSRETIGTMEAFYDRWLSFSGWAVVEGYSHHAGLLEDRRVMSMAPPQRGPCRQLRERCTVLADGRVVGCDQDFQAQYVLGDLNRQSLTEIWQGRQLNALREAHRAGAYSLHPMCEKCDEWHRP